MIILREGGSILTEKLYCWKRIKIEVKICFVCVQRRFDGISLRVKGDGQRYKLNLKTSYNAAMPEYTYQACP